MTPPIFYRNLHNKSIIHMILFSYTMQFKCKIVIIEQIIMNKIGFRKITQEKKSLVKSISTRLITSLKKFQK